MVTSGGNSPGLMRDELLVACSADVLFMLTLTEGANVYCISEVGDD